MNEIVLGGCTSTPLANYLKALGVFRLLSARHPDISGFWRDGRFVLHASVDCEQIEKFFLNDYQPSALVTPWNGRGGFLEGDDEDGESNESTRAGAQMVRMFSKESTAVRFLPLSTILNSINNVPAIGGLNSARAELKRLKAIEKAKGKKNLSDHEREVISKQEALVRNIKGQLLQELRGNLPDDVLSWFDACLTLVNDSDAGVGNNKKSVPSPLLGAGGLDGSMDFGVNYLKRLNDVFDPATGLPRDRAKEWLDAALFGDLTSSLFSSSPQDKKKVSVGQFSPSDAGGCNADNGFEGEALLNPWNTILQLEGAVLFAASTVRRLEGSGDIYASLPFTVAPTAIGEAIALSDEAPRGAKRRTAEMWLPLWRQPAGFRELEAMLREGRITLHRRSAASGFDCARALTSLGVSRGIAQFQRIAFLKRSGDAFFAIDSGRFDVRESAYGGLVDELDDHHQFLTRLRSFVRSKTRSGEWKAGLKLRTLAMQLDEQVVRALRADSCCALLVILELLGEIQTTVARSVELRKEVPFLPRLSERWVLSADDGTRAFRIAKALAGLQGVGDQALPLRSQLFPVRRRFDQWVTDADDKVRTYTEQSGRLTHILCALLQRRLWLAKRLELGDKPLDSAAGVTLEDIAAFLRDDGMDNRIAALLRGLCLCKIPKDTDHGSEGVVPAAFGLLKLALTPNRILHKLKVLAESVEMPIAGGLLGLLTAGNHRNRAIETAWRRLRASGLEPLFPINSLPELDEIAPGRAAAALLIPLRFGASRVLAGTLLKTRELKTEAI